MTAPVSLDIRMRLARFVDAGMLVRARAPKPVIYTLTMDA